MKLEAQTLLRGLCEPPRDRRAYAMAGELHQLLDAHHIEITPLVLTRLEEFLVLYHVVQRIEDTIRAEGLFTSDAAETKKLSSPSKNGAVRAEGDNVTSPGDIAHHDKTAKPSKHEISRRLHPNLDQAVKFRDRLNKTIKDIETLLAASTANGPISLAELLSPLKDQFPKEQPQDDAVAMSV